jgi:glycine/D-amino acid oxidase-like deaminating enzyme
MIVFGGGIVGCATAYFCARDGIQVNLGRQQRPAGDRHLAHARHVRFELGGA